MVTAFFRSKEIQGDICGVVITDNANRDIRDVMG